MNIATIILVYVVIWWLVFFVTLPIGVRAQNESEEGVVEGTVPSAPSNPNLLKKALVASVLAIILTASYYYLIEYDVISLRP